MTIENLKELRDRVQHLHRFLRVDDRIAKMENDRQLTLSPGFWDDNVRATAILKEIKIDKYWADFFDRTNSLVEDAAVLFDFWKEGEATEEEVDTAYDKAPISQSHPPNSSARIAGNHSRTPLAPASRPVPGPGPPAATTLRPTHLPVTRPTPARPSPSFPTTTSICPFLIPQSEPQA